MQQQGILTAIAPNLVEGREFNNPQAIAIDSSATPPILYVADFGNNRVLAYLASVHLVRTYTEAGRALNLSGAHERRDLVVPADFDVPRDIGCVQ